MADDDQRSEEEIALRRDETIKRMIATPPTTLKGKPKRVPEVNQSSKPGKRGS